jgi:pyridinium-3,5-bisthiocarboxylic acid mononucleotide nickel chelatase
MSGTLLGAGGKSSGDGAASNDPRGQHLHIDCASGAAGDMMLGALIDLGVPVDAIGEALDAIGAGRQRLAAHRVVKGGIAAVDVKVDTTGHIIESVAPVAPPPTATPFTPKKRAATEPGMQSTGSFVAIKFRAETHERHVHVDEHGDKVEQVHDHASLAQAAAAAQAATVQGATGVQPHTHAHGHGHAHTHAHGHGHGEHGHYQYSDIRWKIARAPLTDGTRTRALDIFDRLARAESKLHGKSVDEVTFHEVGAIDSIVDVVGTAAALDWLRPASVSCASVAMGHGTVKSAHGMLPVPAPAALEVLREASGIMVDGGLPRELCTPTGAAILAATVTSWTAAPPGRALAIGFGAGDIDLADRPNVVRVTVLQPVKLGASDGHGTATDASASEGVRGDTVWQIDANLDDMSPELCNPASDALFAAGALDVWWTPITMKKGRPALTLSALVDAAKRDDVIATILRETTTIGVRYAELLRTTLTRKIVEVETQYGPIPVKVAYDGEVERNAAPEYEACAAAARAHNVPVKMVFAAALTAYGAK